MALPLSNVVSVTVNLSSPGITRPGFGVPLLLSNTGNAWATPELTRSYTKGSYTTDFPASTPENVALGQIFGQPSPPTTVKVGKGPTKPTQVKTVTISSATVGAIYQVNAYCNGTLWSASYTPVGGDTTTTVATKLIALLSPSAWAALTAYTVGQRVTNDTGGKIYECTVAGTSAGAGGPTGTGAAIVDATVTWKYVVTPTFTAANVANLITATGKAAGSWFALEPLANGGDTKAVSNAMVLVDTTADPGIATDLNAIQSADAAWYALLLLFKSDAIVSTASTGASAWAETNGHLFVCAMSDTACATAAYSTSASDSLAHLTQLGNTYTAGQWHPRDYEFLDASTCGYFLALNPGSDNWRLKTLTGVTVCNFTTTQAGIDGTSNLDLRRAGYYSTLGGISVLAGRGYVESTTYAFIDTRRNIDWYTTNLQADLVNLLIQNSKIPNTNAGRRQIALSIANRNEVGIANGVISGDPLDPNNAISPVTKPYTVTVPLTATPDPNFTAASRTLAGISTTWKLAGAIDAMTVTVNVTQ